MGKKWEMLFDGDSLVVGYEKKLCSFFGKAAGVGRTPVPQST
jgi:hypothetical protein